MIRKFFWVILIGGVFFVASLLLLGVPDKRSKLGRELRFWKGETYPDQFVSDLAEDIRDPAFKRLQPWALDILARYRKGELRTNDFRTFVWVDLDHYVPLSLAEMPDFISLKWAVTNRKHGLVSPQMMVVLGNDQPECVVVHWGDHGVAVGPPDYRIAFDPDIVTNVAPGIYTFGFGE